MVSNRGASQHLNNHIQSLGKTAALIAIDKKLAASGVLDPIVDAAKLRELEDACVVPIDVGSSMDCGKSIVLLAANSGTVQELPAFPILDPDLTVGLPSYPAATC